MGWSAHSPVRPSWPQVRMFAGASRCSVPKTASSCASVRPASGLSRCTRTTRAGDLPAQAEVATGRLDRAGKAPALVVLPHRGNPLAGLTIAHLGAASDPEQRLAPADHRTV